MSKAPGFLRYVLGRQGRLEATIPATMSSGGQRREVDSAACLPPSRQRLPPATGFEAMPAAAPIA